MRHPEARGLLPVEPTDTQPSYLEKVAVAAADDATHRLYATHRLLRRRDSPPLASCIDQWAVYPSPPLFQPRAPTNLVEAAHTFKSASSFSTLGSAVDGAMVGAEAK